MRTQTIFFSWGAYIARPRCRFETRFARIKIYKSLHTTTFSSSVQPAFRRLYSAQLRSNFSQGLPFNFLTPDGVVFPACVYVYLKFVSGVPNSKHAIDVKKMLFVFIPRARLPHVCGAYGICLRCGKCRVCSHSGKVGSRSTF